MEDPFRNQLRENERVLWRGTPDPMAFALTFDSLARAGSALVVITMLLLAPPLNVANPAIAAILSIGLISLLLLAFFTLLTPVLRYVGGRGTAYAITSDRILMSRGFGRRIIPLETHQIECLETRPRSSRRGDIVLRRRIVQGVEGWRTAEHALIAVEDHESVARLIADRLLADPGVQPAS
ncbi:hypothetical protein [Terrihabitans sp. B22-R8]|uniref:hypothetical protein n=1 Tax=Terrihabitans sp. B22-R8 TaxID=3425128 RepID=UPI00403D132E